jgi:hypothetical protein
MGESIRWVVLEEKGKQVRGEAQEGEKEKREEERRKKEKKGKGCGKVLRVEV